MRLTQSCALCSSSPLFLMLQSFHAACRVQAICEKLRRRCAKNLKQAVCEEVMIVGEELGETSEQVGGAAKANLMMCKMLKTVGKKVSVNVQEHSSGQCCYC